jgi:tripartite ATP-independent transporter DctP family solute receptor
MFAPTHPISIALEEFEKMVEERSNGALDIELYGNCVLGSEDEVQQMVLMGSVDSTLLAGMATFESLDERVSIDEIPFLFSKAEDARAAYDGAYGDKLTEILNNCGVENIAFWETGFRHITNNVRPIVEPSDLEGVKLRVYTGLYRVMQFEALGAAAVPMAFNEVFTGLQQGTIDGQENPLGTIESSKFNEVQKYLSLSGHIYQSSIFVFNKDIWNSYSAEEQAILRECALECRDLERKLNEENDAKLVDLLTQGGMEVNEINKPAFIEKVQPVWDYYIEHNGSELIDLAKQYMTD